jgi:importin-8
MYTLPLTAQGLDVNAWFQLLAHVLDTNLDFIDASIVDADQKTLHPWWKTKKWSSRIMCQMIQRYGNPRYSGDEYTVFANYFKNTVANILLAPVMNTLLRKSQGVFVTDIVHRMCLTYTANAIEMSPSYKAVKPHLEFLLFSVIFPTLCISMQVRSSVFTLVITHACTVYSYCFMVGYYII